MSGPEADSLGRLVIPLSLVEPGRDLAIVEFDPGPSASLGSMRAAAERVGARSLGIICNYGDGPVRCVMALDVTGVDDAALLEAAEGMGVEVVEVRRGPVKGFAAARGRTLVAGGARAVIMSARALMGLFLGAREHLGEGAGDAFLYYSGYFSGLEGGRGLSSISREMAVELNMMVVESQGYASDVEISRDGDVYRVRVKDLIECSLLSGHRKGRTSHWFRGVLAGVLSAAEGGEWEVEEVECINDGAEACAFEARRRVMTSGTPGPST